MIRRLKSARMRPLEARRTAEEAKETSMTNTFQDIGVARQIGSYSDAVQGPPDARWVLTAGTPGLSLDGGLAKDITGQAELAWALVRTMLQPAGMTGQDVRKG